MTKLRDGTVTFSGPVRLMVVMKKLLLIGMLLLLLPVYKDQAGSQRIKPLRCRSSDA